MAFRTYKRHLTREDRVAKDIIKACVASGAGIGFLPEAPNFRFTPAAPPEGADSFRPGPGCTDDGPSPRGSIPCGKPKPKHITNWNPTRLDANPMYAYPMRGDSEELRHARFVYAAHGDPEPLREYLAAQAAQRRAVCEELFAVAAE